MRFILRNSAWLLLLPALASSPASADEARFFSHARQLIYEGRRSGEGYFSPDGTRLIFQSEREPGNPFYQIYLLDLRTGDSHRVSPGHGKTTCAFFRPGHDEVLFASTHLDPEARSKQQTELDFRASGQQRRYSWDYDEQMDLFAASPEGSNLRRLTSAPGYDAEGSYSPDGTKIVFTSMRDAYPEEQLSEADRKRLAMDPSYFAEIYLMNADGSDQRRLTRSPGYDGGPFFSPDGQRVIWRRFNAHGDKADIFTMRWDGSDERQLTDFDCMAWAPYYHPSGNYVVFTANKLGFSNFELFIVDAGGQREPVRVTFTDGFDGLPVFSPDGKKLSWTSTRTSDGKAQLFLADWNHEAAQAALSDSPGRTAATRTASTRLPVVSPDISIPDLRSHVEYLASDALEGRLTGSEGNRLAAEYISHQLLAAGCLPITQLGAWAARSNTVSNGPSNGNPFFLPFEFNAGVKLIPGENQLRLLHAGTDSGDAMEFELDKDFRPLSFTASGRVEAEVVFAGYGLAVPGKLGEGHDSYGDLDVSNRVVMVLRYVPEAVEAKRRAELNRYAGLRYKALVARNRGARALLVVSGPNSPNSGQLAPLSLDTSLSGSGIMAASISTNLAQALFQAAGKDLKEAQTALDSENPHAEGGFLIPKLRVSLQTGIERIKQPDQNVAGLLAPFSNSPDAEFVLVGAHYDHLGSGEMNTLARKEEEGQIHNGADDNASGVAAVLELAAALAEERARQPEAFRRGIIFALWSGEELGLIGSSHFAEHPPLPLTNLTAYLNFDMVGRLQENKLNLQGIGSSSAWKRLIEKRNVAAGFNLALQEDPYLPTDTTSFYPKGLPVLSFFTGSHEDYHRPSDDADKVDYAGLERIARFARALLLDLVNNQDRPDYVKVESSPRGGARDQLRAYLGTIPDYATEIKGVKISGVRGQSPADKAGLQGGDVIVELAGQKIQNIYDYTYAIDAVKIGEPTEMVILRNGERVSLKIVPEARP